MSQKLSLANYFIPDKIPQLTQQSHYNYGKAIYERGGVEFIQKSDNRVEAWVGGLEGTVVEGGSQRRRTIFVLSADELQWHCAGNPKNHQIFCKHCVALALALCSDK